jgi:hypothetical protein
MHIYVLSLKYLLRLLTPDTVQYTPLSLNLIIIIIYSTALKMSALHTIIFSRSYPIVLRLISFVCLSHIHFLSYNNFPIFLVMLSSHNYSISYNLLIHFDLQLTV